MATKRFVAKKIGDQYVMQPKDPAAEVENLFWASTGGVLALCGFVRGGPLGWLAMFAGGSMVCRGVTGRNPFCRLAASCDSGAHRIHDPGPSHQNDGRPTAQTPVDSIEEAAMESFPASDPPARTNVTAAGGPAVTQ